MNHKSLLSDSDLIGLGVGTACAIVSYFFIENQFALVFNFLSPTISFFVGMGFNTLLNNFKSRLKKDKIKKTLSILEGKLNNLKNDEYLLEKDKNQRIEQILEELNRFHEEEIKLIAKS